MGQVRKRYALAREGLDERGRRQLVAAEALTIGWGGVRLVAEATGVARATITLGLKELRGQIARAPEGKNRRAGGGRKALVAQAPEVLAELERLVEPTTRGDPESPLRWTCKSTRKLVDALAARGHRVSPEWVRQRLRELHYSLQGNRKTKEGGDHPDRDAQFAHINATATAYLAAGDPVLSVDAKKKELVGDFKNGGRDWAPAGQPEEVRVYDFPIKELGRVTPYGVYDLAANAGWVSVGLDHDTAAFAVATVAAVVGGARPAALSPRAATADHGRWRRQQWVAQPTLEAGVAAVGGRQWPGAHGLSLPPGHQQMEQDRASPLRRHQPELARAAAAHLRNHPQSDCQHDHQHRSHGRELPGQRRVSDWCHGHRRRDGAPPHRAGPLPRRVELHDPAAHRRRWLDYLLAGP